MKDFQVKMVNGANLTMGGISQCAALLALSKKAFLSYLVSPKREYIVVVNVTSTTVIICDVTFQCYLLELFSAHSLLLVSICLLLIVLRLIAYCLLMVAGQFGSLWFLGVVLLSRDRLMRVELITLTTTRYLFLLPFIIYLLLSICVGLVYSLSFLVTFYSQVTLVSTNLLPFFGYL